MPTDAEYGAMIRKFDDWNKLRAFWRKIRKDTAGWPPGKAVGYLVLQAFILDDAAVRWPYPVEIEDEVVEQIDGFVHIGGHLAVDRSRI
jgi:hypothetical protein